MSSSPIRALYVHVPFCARKCNYCAFYSEASNGHRINRYVDALVHEMELVAPNLAPETVFFGGGTPSLLNLRQWQTILQAMERLNLLGAAEWTIECNPATVSLDKARLLRDYGVNRISMGVQSLDEQLLERLGRIHDREMVFRSFDTLCQAGFTNINLDLMFAIPGQTMEMWNHTLDEILAMGTAHLSCYEVIYEEDTSLYHQLQAGCFAVNEDLACDMYDQLLQRAGAAGFEQYEIANFARSTARQGQAEHSPVPSFACRHNINYWRGGSFGGLGPSAAGYFGGKRSKNYSNVDRYCELLEHGQSACESSEQLGALSRAGETAAFGLRMVQGWRFDQFEQVTGQDLRENWETDMTQLEQCGWGHRTPERFHLTPEGLRFADAAAELFLR